MEQKAVDCMVQHIKTFHTQALDAVVADFGEPCQTCRHIENCNYDWLSVMEPLLDKSAIRISMVHPEHLSKPGNDDIYPGQDMGNHQQEGMSKHPSCSPEPSNQLQGLQNS